MVSRAITFWRLHPEPVARLELHLPISIGRLSSCDLSLQEDDISRLHATIELRDGQLTIADQGSRNGVYLKGRRVGVATLSSGAVIRLGQTVLWFSGSEASAKQYIDERIEEESHRKTPIVLIGEPGVGRRTIARRIHRASGRQGPFLFADSPDADVLRAAARGTLLCDLENDKWSALTRKAASTDVRLIALAPEGLVEVQNPSTWIVPPLRDRLDELPGALRAHLADAGAPTTWDADFLEALVCHPFPMNFGELGPLCRGLAGQSEPLGIQALPHSVRANVVEARSAAREGVSRDGLHEALTRHRGNVRRVSHEFGVQRGQLYRLLAGFGLNPDQYRGQVSPADAPPSSMGEERRTLT